MSAEESMAQSMCGVTAQKYLITSAYQPLLKERYDKGK